MVDEAREQLTKFDLLTAVRGRACSGFIEQLFMKQKEKMVKPFRKAGLVTHGEYISDRSGRTTTPGGKLTMVPTTSTLPGVRDQVVNSTANPFVNTTSAKMTMALTVATT